MMSIFTCDVCGSHENYLDTVSEVLAVVGRRIPVENIPLLVCRQCGEMTFSRETAEKVRQLISGREKAAGTVEVELYEFAQARGRVNPGWTKQNNR